MVSLGTPSIRPFVRRKTPTQHPWDGIQITFTIRTHKSPQQETGMEVKVIEKFGVNKITAVQPIFQYRNQTHILQSPSRTVSEYQFIFAFRSQELTFLIFIGETESLAGVTFPTVQRQYWGLCPPIDTNFLSLLVPLLRYVGPVPYSGGYSSDLEPTTEVSLVTWGHSWTSPRDRPQVRPARRPDRRDDSS